MRNIKNRKSSINNVNKNEILKSNTVENIIDKSPILSKMESWATFPCTNPIDVYQCEDMKPLKRDSRTTYAKKRSLGHFAKSPLMDIDEAKSPVSVNNLENETNWKIPLKKAQSSFDDWASLLDK